MFHENFCVGLISFCREKSKLLINKMSLAYFSDYFSNNYIDRNQLCKTQQSPESLISESRYQELGYIFQN